MEWYEILLGVFLFSLWFIPFVYELFISTFIDWNRRNKQNKEWKKQNPGKMRLRCIECKYCKWYYYRPFYNSGGIKIPSYCRLLKKQLSGIGSRCQIPDHSNAFWENKEN